MLATFKSPLSRYVWLRVKQLLHLASILIAPLLANAQQSPWGQAATRLGNEFTGPIARGFALVALVVGGLTVAFSEGGGRRAIGGMIFGLGLALGAATFLNWLFS